MSKWTALAAPALRLLDPERAHAAAVAALRITPLPEPRPDDERLAVEAFGLSFPNPLGLAAGFDKNGTVAAKALALGFGHTEIGTVTPVPQPGNLRPRVFRLPADAAVINRYGFNNVGHAAAHAPLALRRKGAGLVGVNVGANKDTVDRTADYVAGIRRFADVADYFALNVSSPNTPGLRDLQEAAALDDLLARTVETRDRGAARYGRKPVLLKIAPDLDRAALDAIVAAARRRTVDGIIVSNTTITRPPGLHDLATARELGGLSGRPLFALSTQMLAETYLRVDGAFPLVGVGGIDSPAAAWTKIRAGATLIQLYSGLIYAGLGLIAAIKSDVLRRLGENGTVLASHVGVDAPAWCRVPKSGA